MSVCLEKYLLSNSFAEYLGCHEDRSYVDRAICGFFDKGR